MTKSEKPKKATKKKKITKTTSRPKAVKKTAVKSQKTATAKPKTKTKTKRVVSKKVSKVESSPKTAKPIAPKVPQKPPIARSVASVAPIQKSDTSVAPKISAAQAPAAKVATPVAPPQPKVVVIRTPIVVKDLAVKLNAKPAELITRLINAGVFANINQSVSFETAKRIGLEYEIIIEEEERAEETSEKETRVTRAGAKLMARPPIVTFMGHVDHGKTSLLDTIRKTRVASREQGGITQHIGAYELFLKKGAITFLDTPGHEAFTAMRARGAKVTDIVVLVVAADDGIKPQTQEAIDHAMAADATIIVAINKIDLPSANIDRVKKQLMELGLQPEDWGGKTIVVGVSAKTGEGIEKLLEMLLLESEMLELKGDHGAPAQGLVIESKLSQGSGPVATTVVQDGTLNVGDAVICGMNHGRIRAMVNDRGERVQSAPPSMPVEISGLSGVPKAGDLLRVVASEVEARRIIEQKNLEQKSGAQHSHIHLEDLYSEISAGHIETLNIVVKADVQGSVEALRGVLGQIESEKVKLKVIHSAVGAISKSDALLAAASNAIIIGFHVGVAGDAEATIKLEKVDVHIYGVIYKVKESIEKAMKGLLKPEKVEVYMGTAEVRQIFKVSKIGMIAGSMVTKGKIVRNLPCRVLRNGKEVVRTKITGLKRFKDDAREVAQGYECGISVADSGALSVGDRIEAFEIKTEIID